MYCGGALGTKSRLSVRQKCTRWGGCGEGGWRRAAAGGGGSGGSGSGGRFSSLLFVCTNRREKKSRRVNEENVQKSAREDMSQETESGSVGVAGEKRGRGCFLKTNLKCLERSVEDFFAYLCKRQSYRMSIHEIYSYRGRKLDCK